MSSLSSTDWKEVSPDPDPSNDLEYELIELDVIETTAGGEPQVLVLPEDEDMLREDAFMVVEEGGVCDLETMV